MKKEADIKYNGIGNLMIPCLVCEMKDLASYGMRDTYLVDKKRMPSDHDRVLICAYCKTIWKFYDLIEDENLLRRVNVRRELAMREIRLKHIAEAVGHSTSYVSCVIAGKRNSKRIWEEIEKQCGMSFRK